MAVLAATVLAYILCISNWTLGAILLCCCYQFWQRRNETLFIKRRGNIVVAYTLMACGVLLIGYPLHFFAYWPMVASAEVGVTNLALKLCANILWAPCYQSLVFLFLCRYWLIYYDIQFAHSCLNLEWKQYITKNVNTVKTETWFMDKRATLGNGAYMTKRAVLLAAIGSIFFATNAVLLTLEMTELRIHHVVIAIAFIITLLVIIMLWRKLPIFNDNIYLYKEFSLTFYFWLFLAVLYLIVSVTELTTAQSYVLDLIRYTAVIATATLMAFILPFVSTFWVLHQIKLSHQIELANNLSFVELASQQSMSSTSVQSVDSINDILSDIDTLNLFMQHVTKEFCMEILLSLIEFDQFKKAIMAELGQTDIDQVVESTLITIHITEDAPRSDIVYGETETDGIQKYKEIAHKLYRKYIVPDAQFQINIPFQTKKVLDSRLHDYDEWMKESNAIKLSDLALLYERCMAEMHHLLLDTKTRFVYQKM